jgi:predicted nucleotide-binding protein
VVRSLGSDSSPAVRLAVEALGIRTKGNTQEKFERQKASLLRALQLTLAALGEDLYGELRAPKSVSSSPALSNKIFVVHGHDDALKTDVERFLHEIGLEPVVLHRQPDQGRTIIEKFEMHSDVGYALILLTPDDIAFDKSEQHLPDDQRHLEARARPNVIFELGAASRAS